MLKAKVVKTKVVYAAVDNDLQILLDKRVAQRKGELWNAIIKSEKTYEDILGYVKLEVSAEE